MSARVAGKVALLSGCGGAKGLDVARVLAGEGAIVYVSDVEETRALPSQNRLPKVVTSAI